VSPHNDYSFKSKELIMSKENALAFYKTVTGDDGLIAKIKETKGNQDALLALAKESGYNFAWQDWVDVTTDIMSQNPGEINLSDEELEAVAGGVGQIETMGVCPTFACYTYYCPTRNAAECFPDLGGDIPPPGEVPPPPPRP
jgi:predicted ribosomally synthesized peptide with nif11-like leader